MVESKEYLIFYNVDNPLFEVVDLSKMALLSKEKLVLSEVLGCNCNVGNGKDKCLEIQLCNE